MKRVELIINASYEWHYSPELPEWDGMFWAVTKYGDVRPFMYTVKEGWNTYVGEDGTIKPNDDREGWLKYLVAWTYGPKLISARVADDV